MFMLKHLKMSGCPVNPDHIVCAPCDYSRSGGFSPQAGAIVMCQGKFFNKRHMEDTLVHELVHMYDHCKFKVDWNDLRHHACSEVSIHLVMLCGFLYVPRSTFTCFPSLTFVFWTLLIIIRLEPCDWSHDTDCCTFSHLKQIRANSLSGDCRYMRELRRGFPSFSKQHQVRGCFLYP